MSRARRTLVTAAIAVVVFLAAAAVAAAAPIAGSEDQDAAEYYTLLEHHTRWVETTWDAAAGSYKLADYDFGSVLGNAVLLKFGTYDASQTGISRDLLADHTVRTIERFAASNRWVNPSGEWGRGVYFDSTFESYFVAGARLMWDDLDATTRANVDTIAREAADNIVALGAGNDPLSPGWTTNGLLGGYRSDTKMEEMGTRTMPLAMALAYEPNDPAVASWRTWLDRWTISMTGLPAADQANPTLVDGQPISAWTQAHNIFDTFVTENHGSLASIYQESAGAYPGRDVVQFLIAGAPVPEALRSVPSARELGSTLERIGTDAGVAEDFMVADRHHLYGRNVLPISYRAVVLGDPYAARAERLLLDHLAPYQAYAPADRLTKFSGEAKYEPEARAELAMAYLLHYARAQLGGGARPVSKQQYFAGRSGATDYGADAAFVAQQTPKALSAAVTKPGFTKFAYLPQHDDWLFDVSASSPALLPSTGLALTGRTVHVYRAARDGYDASATVVTTAGGAAGYATLPDGEAVYATTGLGAGEGALRVTNLTMPGVPGLDGDRTFTGADGSVTLAGAADGGLGDGGIDDLHFDATSARYVRFQGVRPAGAYGYSLFGLEVHDGSGADLAQGKPTTASSFDAVAPPGPFPPQAATDGDPTTRWAVSRPERGRADSWLQVDLGTAQRFDDVRLSFDPAYAAQYRIEASDDGTTWHDLATVPTQHTFAGEWLNVDGRAGFVVRGSTNPIAVTGTSATLSSGPAAGAAGMVVEARPAESASRTAAAAADAAPSGGPPALRASLAGGFLSLFNLGSGELSNVQLTLPQSGRDLRLYRGVQTTGSGQTSYAVDLAGHDGRVEAPRFALETRSGSDLRIEVTDSQHVTVTNPAGRGVAFVSLRSLATGERRLTAVPAGRARALRFTRGRRTPSVNLATTMTTYPTSPLPPGMSDPDLAVDGDASTSWRPGPDGRMVVDLGRVRALGALQAQWTHGQEPAIEVGLSDDGVTYRPVTSGRGRLALDGASGRWVAVRVPGWQPGDPQLDELTIDQQVGP
jgi:type II secretory pathway pseudopilin PulG